jgi:hypothetical protein
MLFKHCLKYNRDAEYLEAAYTFDDKDKEAIASEAAKYDTIVITNFFVRGRLSNNEFIEELMKANPDKKFVIITNTPYDLSIPKGSENLIITFATSPDNIEVAAGAIFGEIIPEGEYPVKWRRS